MLLLCKIAMTDVLQVWIGMKWDKSDSGPSHCVCCYACRFSRWTSLPDECHHQCTDIRDGHPGSHELFPSPVLTGPSTQEGTHQFGVEWHKKPSLWLTLTGPFSREKDSLTIPCVTAVSVFIQTECQPAFDICRFDRFHSVVRQHDDSERILMVITLVT